MFYCIIPVLQSRISKKKIIHTFTEIKKYIEGFLLFTKPSTMFNVREENIENVNPIGFIICYKTMGFL